MFEHVDSNCLQIEQSLPEGYYACTEDDGDIVIRNLKRESLQWGYDRSKFWEENTNILKDYPYCKNYNFQYIEMYCWGESEHFGCDYEKNGCFIKPDDVVVDIGANIGMFSRRAIERGAKKVYAYEPSNDAFKCLLLNVDASKVESYKASISSHTGFTEMRVTEGSYPMASTDDPRELLSIENVPCYTMDDLMNFDVLPSKIDFLKIDAEGGEIGIFEGLSAENLLNVDRIAMETHHNAVDGGEHNRKIAQLLERITSTFTSHYQLSYKVGEQEYWVQTITAWR